MLLFYSGAEASKNIPRMKDASKMFSFEMLRKGEDGNTTRWKLFRRAIRHRRKHMKVKE